MGHSTFVYLDDGFTSQSDEILALAASSIQKQDLSSSGFMFNDEKSHWLPMQVGERLGFIIDTVSMQFQVPDKKLNKIKSLLDDSIQDKQLSYRHRARIAGSIIALSLAVGPICRLFKHQMYFTIESRHRGWDESITLSPPVLEELRF